MNDLIYINDIMSVPNFKEGDTVVFVSVDVLDLHIGDICTITKISIDNDGIYRCYIKERNLINGLYCNRFMSLLEYNANKYNI